MIVIGHQVDRRRFVEQVLRSIAWRNANFRHTTRKEPEHEDL